MDATIVELCNGVDDTQEGLVDEGCPCASFDVTLTAPVAKPSLVWTGQDLRVVVQDDGDLVIRSLVDGAWSVSLNVGQVPAMVNSPYRAHDLAWSGSTLAVVRVAHTVPPPGLGRTSELAFFDADGVVLQRHTLPMDVYWSNVAWAGDRFVVVGAAAPSASEGLAYAEYTTTGTLIAGPIRARHASEVQQVDSIVASTTKYAIGVQYFMDPSIVFIDRVTHASEIHALPFGRSGGWVSIATKASGFAVTKAAGGYTGTSDGLRLFDSQGAPQPLLALPWGALTNALRATTTGFTAFGVLPYSDSAHQYALVKLDDTGQPASPPTSPLAVTGSDFFSNIHVVTADKRFAIASMDSYGVLRVIQGCD